MRSCSSKFCRNTVRTGKLCSKCRSRKYRRDNPVRCSYINLKMNAKRRGKEFTITLEEFTQFCKETNYIAGAGRSSASYHIDRIDETKGYSIDNIQTLTNAENSKKYLKYSKDASGKPYKYWVESPPVIDQDINTNDCPF